MDQQRRLQPARQQDDASVVKAYDDSENALQASVAIITQFDQADLEKDEVAGAIVDIDKQKAAVKERVRDTFKQQGKFITEGELDASVERYFSGQWEFEQDPPTLETALARMYVNRGFWGRTVAKAALITALTVGGGYTISHVNTRIRQEAAEERLSKTYTEAKMASDRIAHLRDEATAVGLPEQEQSRLKLLLDDADAKLTGANALMVPYKSEKGMVVRDYEPVAKVVADADHAIADAQDPLRTAEGIIDTQRQLEVSKLSLEAVIQQIKRSKGPKVLVEQSEAVYAQATAALQNRDFGKVKSYEQRLYANRDSIDAMLQLPLEVERAYTSITAVVKDGSARAQSDSLYKTAKEAERLADGARLKETLEGLKSLDTVLNQSYSLTIVGGKWRYPNSNPNVKTFYLLLEARGPNGAPLPMTVKNEETGQMETVTQWGERVPESVYEGVKNDKQSNGRITKDAFGSKEKGYINENITFPGPDGPIQKQGQITKW